MPKKKSKELEKVSSVEMETMMAILTSPTYTEAADKLGMTLEGLKKRRDKYEIDKKIDAMTTEAMQRLKMGSVKAANELIYQLEDRIVNNRNKAANDILGYVMPKQGTNINIGQVGGEMSIEFVGESNE